jgi:hypothetical protein
MGLRRPRDPEHHGLSGRKECIEKKVFLRINHFLEKWRIANTGILERWSIGKFIVDILSQVCGYYKI